MYTSIISFQVPLIIFFYIFFRKENFSIFLIFPYTHHFSTYIIKCSSLFLTFLAFVIFPLYKLSKETQSIYFICIFVKAKMVSELFYLFLIFSYVLSNISIATTTYQILASDICCTRKFINFWFS